MLLYSAEVLKEDAYSDKRSTIGENKSIFKGLKMENLKSSAAVRPVSRAERRF